MGNEWNFKFKIAEKTIEWYYSTNTNCTDQYIRTHSNASILCFQLIKELCEFIYGFR